MIVVEALIVIIVVVIVIATIVAVVAFLLFNNPTRNAEMTLPRRSSANTDVIAHRREQ